ARLVRDAQIGLLWEGTSNINALDLIGRAVGKSHAHEPLAALLRGRLEEAESILPAAFADRLRTALSRALRLAEQVAREPASEPQPRRAATALYNATSAALLAWEGTRDATDARRVLLARFVLEHRLSPSDPLEPEDAAWEAPAITALLEGTPVPRARALS